MEERDEKKGKRSCGITLHRSHTHKVKGHSPVTWLHILTHIVRKSGGGGAAELEIARWGRRERAGSDSWNVKPGLPGNKRVRSRSHTVTFATLPQLRYLPELALPCLHNPD